MYSVTSTFAIVTDKKMSIIFETQVLNNIKHPYIKIFYNLPMRLQA